MPPEFRSKLLPAEILESRVTLRIPGSTANLGPAFDTIGIALDVYSWLDVCLLGQNDPAVPLITQCGAITSQLPSDQSNIIYKVVSKVILETTSDLTSESKANANSESNSESNWASKSKQKLDRNILSRIRVVSYSDIPLGRGLGSSGSIIIGSVFAASILSGQKPVAEKLIAKSSYFENHIDNLSASLFGGLVVSLSSSDSIIAKKIHWPVRWKLIALVPSYSVSTASARSVLPKMYSRADVVENLQRVSLLTAAICHEDAALFRQSLQDKIHEPYRLELVPELVELRRALKDKPVLGSVLSGAGSSMLVIVEEENYDGILLFLKSWARQHETDIGVIEANVDNDGLTVISDDLNAVEKVFDK
jgi:homoserine kinase